MSRVFLDFVSSFETQGIAKTYCLGLIKTKLYDEEMGFLSKYDLNNQFPDVKAWEEFSLYK